MNLQEAIYTELEALTETPSGFKYLLAVSGGIDSMVLIDCFSQLNLSFEVAHYNYQLRGKESDEDEQLVRETCEKLNIPFHLKKTNTEDYCTENKISIQEAARNLRYEWFDQILSKQNLDYVVTAHHANDSIETFFINLLRGAGIKGLSGIPQINNRVIRPVLKQKRSDIEEYALANGILFRNDSSNESTKYKRNFIRHKIVPKLLELDQNAENSILRSLELLRETNLYLESSIAKDISDLSHEKNGCTIFTHNEQTPAIVWFYAFKKFGFSSSQIEDIILPKTATGSKFYSNSHELLVDRNQFILKKSDASTEHQYTIYSPGEIQTPFAITIKELETPVEVETSKNVAILDAETLIFPLTLRKWKEGDWFIPLGMKGKKKLSDYFIDNKISLFDKEQIWVLESNNDIAWIINHRIDDRYKVKINSKKVIRIETENKK